MRNPFVWLRGQHERELFGETPEPEPQSASMAARVELLEGLIERQSIEQDRQKETAERLTHALEQVRERLDEVDETNRRQHEELSSELRETRGAVEELTDRLDRETEGQDMLRDGLAKLTDTFDHQLTETEKAIKGLRAAQASELDELNSRLETVSDASSGRFFRIASWLEEAPRAEPSKAEAGRKTSMPWLHARKESEKRLRSVESRMSSLAQAFDRFLSEGRKQAEHIRESVESGTTETLDF